MIIELSKAPQANRAAVLSTNIKVAASVHEAGHAFAAWLCRKRMPEVVMPAITDLAGVQIVDSHAETRIQKLGLSAKMIEFIAMSGYCSELLFQDEAAMRAGVASYVHADKAINDFKLVAHIRKDTYLSDLLRGDNASVDRGVAYVNKQYFQSNYDQLKKYRSKIVRLSQDIYDNWHQNGFKKFSYVPKPVK